MMNVRMLLFLSIVLIECTYIAMEKPDVEDCINDTLRKKIGLLGLKDSNTQELIPSDIQRRIASCMIMDFLCDTALEIRESCPLTIDNNPENTFDMIAMSDDDTIVVGAEVRTLDIAYIWNMQGTLLHTLKGHNDVIKEIILSHENKYIVTLSNGSIKIWDRTTGRIRHTLNPCVSYINSMHITPDDKQLVTVLLREEGLNIIEIWDIEEGKSLLQFPIFDHHCIASLLMRYKNKQIITLSCRASLKLWDVVTGTLIRTLKDRGKNNTQDLVLVKDDTYLIFPDEEMLWICNVDTGDSWQAFGTREQGQSIQVVRLSSDHTRLIVMTCTGLVEIWNVLNEQLLYTSSYTYLPFTLLLTEFDGLGNRYFKAVENYVEVYDIKTGKLVHRLVGHPHRINILKVNADGNRVITACDRHTKIWNFTQSYARQWLENNILPLQANLIARAYRATKASKDFEISDNVKDDMLIWISLPSYVRDYISLYTRIRCVEPS